MKYSQNLHLKYHAIDIMNTIHHLSIDSTGLAVLFFTCFVIGMISSSLDFVYSIKKWYINVFN